MPILLFASSEVLAVTDQFTYLGSTITSNLSLDREIDKRIAKNAGVLAKLSKRVWDNNQLTLNTKLKVYRACVLSIQLYGSESWMTYATQETAWNAFTLAAYDESLTSHGKTKSPTLPCWSKMAP